MGQKQETKDTPIENKETKLLLTGDKTIHLKSKKNAHLPPKNPKLEKGWGGWKGKSLSLLDLYQEKPCLLFFVFLIPK